MYVWCIGTMPEICDIHEGTETLATMHTVAVDIPNVFDGHHYYFTVQVVILLHFNLQNIEQKYSLIEHYHLVQVTNNHVNVVKKMYYYLES